MLDGVPLDVDESGANFELVRACGCGVGRRPQGGCRGEEALHGLQNCWDRIYGIGFPSSSAGVVPLGHPKLDTLYQPTTTHSLHILDIWVSSALSVIADALHNLPHVRSNTSQHAAYPHPAAIAKRRWSNL